MTEAESNYLKTVAPMAQSSERIYGVPASITIAQSILESGWGKSRLTLQCNNYFGIKATHYSDPSSYKEFQTQEDTAPGKAVTVSADFACYRDPAMSFIAHARLLASSSRYAPAMLVRSDAAAFAQKLQDCGYSTNFRYAAELMQLVKEFDLTQYDREPEPPAAGKALAA